MKTQQNKQQQSFKPTSLSTLKQLIWFLVRLQTYTTLAYTTYQEIQAAQQMQRNRVTRLSPEQFFVDPEVNIKIQHRQQNNIPQIL